MHEVATIAKTHMHIPKIKEQKRNSWCKRETVRTHTHQATSIWLMTLTMMIIRINIYKGKYDGIVNSLAHWMDGSISCASHFRMNHWGFRGMVWTILHPGIVRAWDTAMYTFDSYADDSIVSFSNNFVGCFSHIDRYAFFSLFRISIRIASRFQSLFDSPSRTVGGSCSIPLSDGWFPAEHLNTDCIPIHNSIKCVLKLCIECEHKLNFLPFLHGFPSRFILDFSFSFFFVVVNSKPSIPPHCLISKYAMAKWWMHLSVCVHAIQSYLIWKTIPTSF